MKRIARTPIVVVSILIALATAPQANAGSGCSANDAYGSNCGATGNTGVSAGHDDGSYSVTLYTSSGESHTVSAGGGGAPTQHYEWDIVPACFRNTPTSADAVCGAFTACPDPQDFRWWVYWRDTTVPGDPWHFAGAQCLGHNPTVNVAQAKASVASAFKSTRVEAGTLNVQPPKAAIVNLPAVFYVVTPARLDLTLTAFGRAVTLTATPAAYVWHWGDGTTTTTTDPGHPYPHETVTHTYPKPGAVAVSVDVYWQASYTIAGINQTFTITGPLNTLPHATAGPRTLPVAEARSHLVS